MKILALEPFYGGSHRAFLDGWIARSRHQWQVSGLPATKWKWRMRHAAITCAEMAGESIDAGQRFDLLFCSDMLNLAEFRGLARPEIAALPSVVYFHENQFTYPVQEELERDYHFAMTNIMTAVAASQVWFNSQFHQDSFLTAVGSFIDRMPDYRPKECNESIRRKSLVFPPGIERFPEREDRSPGPLHVLWAARWEHDKNPETFFAALEEIRNRGVNFRLSVIGEQFERQPGIFANAHERFSAEIVHWGYLSTRDDYRKCLLSADVIISTALHEFFGISVVEAIAAGCYPMLPRRLAYPEILAPFGNENLDRYLYDGSSDQLADRLCELAVRIDRGSLPNMREFSTRFYWENVAPKMDAALEKLAS